MNRKILSQENDAHKTIFTIVSDETKKTWRIYKCGLDTANLVDIDTAGIAMVDVTMVATVDMTKLLETFKDRI